MTQRKRVKFLAFCLGTTALISAPAFAAGTLAPDTGAVETHAESTVMRAPFSVARTRMREALEKANGETRTPAARALLDFYLERGLYPEAMVDAATLLPETDPALQNKAVRARLEIARLMTTSGRETGASPFENADAELFWQMAASALRGEAIPGPGTDTAQALRALDELFAQPAPVQHDLALPLTDALLGSGNADALRAFADKLAARGPGLLSYTCKQWLTARLAEFEGFPEAAKARYGALGTPDNRCAAHGRLRLALLQLASKRFDPERIKQDMKALAASWYGDEIEEGALRVLALLERDEGDPVRALAWMRLLADRFPAAMDEEHVAEAASQLAAALFSRSSRTDVESWQKKRRAYLEFLTDDAVRRQEDERFAALLLAGGEYREAAKLGRRLLAALPQDADADAGKDAQAGIAAQKRKLTLLIVEAELADGDPQKALESLSTLHDFEDPAGWTPGETDIYLNALIAADRLDEANVRLAHLLNAAQIRRLAESYASAEDWEQAYHLLKAPLEKGGDPELTPGYYDLFASAALLSGNEEAAAGPLRRNDAGWRGRSALAGIAALPAKAARAGKEPEEKVEALIEETKALVGLAKTL